MLHRFADLVWQRDVQLVLKLLRLGGEFSLEFFDHDATAGQENGSARLGGRAPMMFSFIVPSGLMLVQTFRSTFA
jgi:hypothetical protein